MRQSDARLGPGFAVGLKRPELDMTATLINGTAIAEGVREECKGRVDLLKGRGITPGLAVVIVGENAASVVYVRNKVKACQAIGMHSEHHALAATVSEKALLDAVDALNRNPAIHGILVQLPLPQHIDSRKVIAAKLAASMD